MSKVVRRLASSLVTLTTNPPPTPACDAKPFSEMASPAGWPLIGHLPLLANKNNQLNMDKMFHRLRQECGDIYRISLPGTGNMVILFRPEDVRTLYAADGKIPHQQVMALLKETKLTNTYNVDCAGV